jgi:hypothetical protein
LEKPRSLTIGASSLTASCLAVDVKLHPKKHHPSVLVLSFISLQAANGVGTSGKKLKQDAPDFRYKKVCILYCLGFENCGYILIAMFGQIFHAFVKVLLFSLYHETC